MRYLVRLWLLVHASVSEVSGFSNCLREGGPRLLGRHSSPFGVLVPPQEYKKMEHLRIQCFASFDSGYPCVSLRH